MMSYSQFSKIFIVLFLAISFSLFFILSLTFIYDSHQFFHKPIFRKTTFFNEMRLQASGLIQNYPFESVILGTSMLENTSSQEAQEKLKSSFVNLSLHGSSFNERAVILNYLFYKRKNIKHILYSIDPHVRLISSEVIPTRNFDYLYDTKNYFKPIIFYLNQERFLCALRYSHSSFCIGGGGGFSQFNHVEKFL